MWPCRSLVATNEITVGELFGATVGGGVGLCWGAAGVHVQSQRAETRRSLLRMGGNLVLKQAQSWEKPLSFVLWTEAPTPVVSEAAVRLGCQTLRLVGASLCLLLKALGQGYSRMQSG